MDKPWKLVLLLIGIFAAGIVTGGFVMMRFGRQLFPAHRGAEEWGPTRLKRLTERLDLTPDQVEKIRPIIHKDSEELSRLRNSSLGETRKVLEQLEHDVSAVLTPEQKTKYDEMNREMRERMQRLMRGPRPGHEHGPGEPPSVSPGDATPAKPPGG
jgi:Spy/CpxP family protein refolding chaperone